MARRVVLIVLGAVLLVIGALAAIGGGALLALFGSNNTLSSGVQHVVTLTRALVSPTGLIQGASGAQTVVGNVRLRFTATPVGAGHQLFLGIGPAGAVDRYLRGASYAVATDVSVSPFNLTLERHGGTATPPLPGSQSFWVARASGNHPTLTWIVTSGSYRVVVMNADAAAPVNFTGSLDLTIPHSFAIGIGLLIGGIVLIVIGIVLIVLGARAWPQSRPVPDPAAGALARPGAHQVLPGAGAGHRRGLTKPAASRARHRVVMELTRLPGRLGRFLARATSLNDAVYYVVVWAWHRVPELVWANPGDDRDCMGEVAGQASAAVGLGHLLLLAQQVMCPFRLASGTPMTVAAMLHSASVLTEGLWCAGSRCRVG